MENETWIEKDVENKGEGGENVLAGRSPGDKGGGRSRGHRHHHQHLRDALRGEGGGGADWQLEGGARKRVKDAKIERDEKLPDIRRAEEESVDHLQGRVHHHRGHGGAGAGARGGAVQTWNGKSELFVVKNDAGTKTERGLPQAAGTDRSSSIPPIGSKVLSKGFKEGRQDEEEGGCQAKKIESKIEERRQESGRRSGFTNKFLSTNICINRLDKKITYRGSGETETARGSGSSSSSSSASPQAPQSPASSSTLVELATRSPLIGRRSPSPVQLVAGRTMSANNCRNKFQIPGNSKTTEAAAKYEGNNELGGKV